MRHFLLTLSLLAAGTSLGAQKPEPPLGFFPDSVARQLAWESKLDGQLQADRIGKWIERLSARPHAVGSPYGKENAEWIADQFRSWGYQTSIEEYQVLFPTPRTRLLTMVHPKSFQAGLVEPPLAGDSTSGQTDEQLPTYNAYSADGDVEGLLVYVNYGVPEDYLELERRGIDVSGKIVIARYGGSWRGIKPKVAAQKGALGCILYSDPRDDGYFRGQVYPEGPFRNSQGVQRGSVADMPTYPGDPLTPGRGAVKGASRLERGEAPTLSRIPVLPISHADAQPLLEAMGGPVAPAGWRGALPLTYRLGPGPARVRLKLEFDWQLAPAYNVIAMLPGSERPDQWIIRGNHHDAWVNGAQDPVSGMASMMEEARAVAQLAEQGWTPKRTIIYAAWDAEEPGLLGSTEWAEHHADELRRKAAVYINSDSNGRGFLRVGGSHSLERFINQVARSVKDPQTGVSVWERLRARRLANAPLSDTRIWEGENLPIAALGSGSDYTPFLQHLGIASLNLGYGGENAGGSYHSIYDSFDHYSRFGDPGFDYGVAQAQTVGRAVLRLAAADWLPFHHVDLSNVVNKYIGELESLVERMRAETREHNRRLENQIWRLAADPKETYVPPPAREPVPHLNFAPLHNAMEELEKSARRLAGGLENGEFRLNDESQERLDQLLLQSERMLTHESGLPGRPWYIHHIYAPGFYTGYGVKTLPGVREAIELRAWDEAEQQAVRLAGVLERLARHLEDASQLLESASSR